MTAIWDFPEEIEIKNENLFSCHHCPTFSFLSVFKNSFDAGENFYVDVGQIKEQFQRPDIFKKTLCRTLSNTVD